jgi:hypothetical protein
LKHEDRAATLLSSKRRGSFAGKSSPGTRLVIEPIKYVRLNHRSAGVRRHAQDRNQRGGNSCAPELSP